jgi:Uma2 family endonuclease
MATATPIPATLDDLSKVKDKAELIAGRIVNIMPSGEYPGTVALEIVVKIREYVTQTGRGRAFGDNVGFALSSPLPNGRLSFSPDAAYVETAGAKNMRFHAGAPTFAVEVRSENDYTPKAEREIAAKRDDYFLAGTLVVWDVDPVGGTITSYKTANPSSSVVFRRGDLADAEPALPGWRVKVDEVFA